jgi:integrase
MPKGKRDYLFKRRGSENFWIKLRSPAGRVERSLGTSDRREAEVLALPLIAQHKAALLAARPRQETKWDPVLAAGGLYTGDALAQLLEEDEDPDHVAGLKAAAEWAQDGGRIFATQRELHYLNSEGQTIRTVPNGGPAIFYFGQAGALAEVLSERPSVAVKNGDDAIFETYIRHANISGYYEREARATWALFKSLCDKPLKDADRDDGRKLVVHFENEGLKSASIRKKIGWLVSAVNLAIREGKLKFNPFSSIVPDRNDSLRRVPLSDADMKAIKGNIGWLSEPDQLLLRLLGSTGMRLSEAFEIEGEEKEKRCRYVIVGKKTEQSLRRVPLPASVLPFLPKKITGPLFGRDLVDPADTASKHLNRFLRECGISDPAKVVHSLRHRAQDRLRAAGCPEDVRWAILGHEERTVAAGYGEGFPVPVLKRWIDKIGM